MHKRTAVLVLALLAAALVERESWPTDLTSIQDQYSLTDLAAYALHGHPTHRSAFAVPGPGRSPVHVVLSAAEHDLAPPPHAHPRARTGS